ncbi:hypothetical protein [Chryseobacterium sp. SIMBA_038]|uniref:hypothetical protein n=1 Tax=Chryseobacterium sp. SIMBA_038 TaxID=3085780 RepID=UPI0039784AE7
MSDPNYIAAKTFLNMLSDEQKIKLCKQILEGVESKKNIKKNRVKDYLKYLERK